MYRTRAETGGSPTAERLAGTADTDGVIAQAGKAAVQVSTGHPGAALRTVFTALRQVNPELRGKVMNEARRVLLNPDPEAVRAFARRVEQANMSEAGRQEVLATVINATSRTSAGSTVAP